VVIPVHDENELAFGFRPFVTWGLSAANVIIFLYFILLPAGTSLLLAYQYGMVPAFMTGAIEVETLDLPIRPELTLFTYMFLHGNWLHLAGNMIFLWVFGDNVEAATGHVRFLILYLLSGVAGAAVHVVSDPQSSSPLIGASAAIAGLVAAYLLLQPFSRVTLLVLGIITVRVRAFWVLGTWIAWQIVNALLIVPESETAYWSHLGGLAAGALLFLVLRKPDVKLFNAFRLAKPPAAHNG
jgi:membrane associated rhomboid family serine protease